MIVTRETPGWTFHAGDRLWQRLTLEIPKGSPPGRYAVFVGIERMQQGVAAAREVFRVVE